MITCSCVVISWTNICANALEIKIIKLLLEISTVPVFHFLSFTSSLTKNFKLKECNEWIKLIEREKAGHKEWESNLFDRVRTGILGKTT